MAIATGGAVPEGADVVLPLEYVDEHDTESSRCRTSSSAAAMSAREAVTSPPARSSCRRVRGWARSDRRPRRGGRRRGRLRASPAAAPRDRHRAAPSRRGARRGSDLRIERADARGVAGLGRRRGRAARRRWRTSRALHRDALGRALAGADVVVTSGGVSVGPHDLVRAVGDELGVEERLLGRRSEAGQAPGVRRQRRHARLRTAGQPCVGAGRRELFVRPPCSRCRAPPSGRRGCTACWRRGSSQCRPGRARPGTLARRGGRDTARAGHRAGVAHDRPRGRGRHAGAHSARRRRARGRNGCALPAARLRRLTRSRYPAPESRLVVAAQRRRHR